MKSLGYVHTPIAEHHRWSPYSRRSIGTGRGELNRDARLFLHRMRWRKPPRQYVLMLSAALLAVLVHLIGLMALLLVRPPPATGPVPLGQENAIQVRFIDSRPPPPPPPIPALPPPPSALVAKHAASPPSRAPRKAPVPVPARARPETRVKLPPVQVAVAKPVVAPAKIPPLPVTPSTPSPVKPQEQTQKALPPVALPPPRLVHEPSVMAVPPPKVTLPETMPGIVTATARAIPKPESAPLPAIAPAVPVSITRVQPLPVSAVSARLAIQPAPVASVAPAVAASQALPAAPMSAPQVQIAAIQAPPAQRLQLPKTPVLARVRPVRATPARAASVPARVVSVAPPPAPATTDWALQPDTFSRLPAAQPGHGTAAHRQAGKGSPQGVPAFVQPRPQGNSNVMTREYHGFKYKRTIFDQYWAPDNQGLLTSLLQRLVDTLSFHKTIDLGHGARIYCGGWLLGFGCGGAPPPPMSKMSNDRRLNMAPAKPLVPGLGASAAKPPSTPPPRSSDQAVKCETARVAGGPLPPGCTASKGALDGWKQHD